MTKGDAGRETDQVRSSADRPAHDEEQFAILPVLSEGFIRRWRGLGGCFL
jgi:hypothetical protein